MIGAEMLGVVSSEFKLLLEVQISAYWRQKFYEIYYPLRRYRTSAIS